MQYQTNSLSSNGWIDVAGSEGTNGWQISILPDVDFAFYRLGLP